MSEKKKKKKKEKVIYIDDGRTIADMSNVRGGISSNRGKSNVTFSSAWKTYWSAVRMMLIPTLIVIGIISIAYLIMYFSLKGF